MELRKYYIRGVGVGLIIAWVTSAVAYWKAGTSAGVALIGLEFILSVIFLAISIFMKDKTK
jgi:predicted branched-subunit amino acid permease